MIASSHGLAGPFPSSGHAPAPAGLRHVLLGNSQPVSLSYLAKVRLGYPHGFALSVHTRARARETGQLSVTGTRIHVTQIMDTKCELALPCPGGRSLFRVSLHPCQCSSCMPVASFQTSYSSTTFRILESCSIIAIWFPLAFSSSRNSHTAMARRMPSVIVSPLRSISALKASASAAPRFIDSRTRWPLS